MATFKIFCEPIVEFDPNLHMDLHGSRAANTLHERGYLLGIVKYHIIVEKHENSEVYLSHYYWDVDLKFNPGELFKSYEKDNIIVCEESCGGLISQAVPEPDFIVSLSMIAGALLLLAKRKIERP